MRRQLILALRIIGCHIALVVVTGLTFDEVMSEMTRQEIPLIDTKGLSAMRT